MIPSARPPHQTSGDLEPTARLVLIREISLRAVSPAERLFQRLAHTARTVIGFAQMQRNDPLQPAIDNVTEELRCLPVVEVSDLRRDALLQVLWVVPGPERLDIVIELDRHRVTAGEMRPDVRRNVARVTQNT